VANNEHVALLREGAAAWNKWRVPNSGTSFQLLEKADLSGANLADANLNGADLDGANLTDANLTQTDLSNARLFHANMARADLTRAVLIGAHMTHARLDSALLIAGNLSHAVLTDAKLAHADLTGARLTHADLTGADLTRAKLTRAKLTDAGLTRANLTRANLKDADLTRANLFRADLAGADLTRANLSHASLPGANLAHADLTGATLVLANFTVTNLKSTNLTGATLFETMFVDADLSRSVGLASCIHGGHSTLDHRTLVNSGSLPLQFLRGCGLPDRFIDYLPSLLDAEPIQFYSCFISYSTHNQEFADRLYADLQSNGVRCWFAPHDLQPGRKMHEQIDEAIRIYDRLLLILSTESMGSSWVKTEIAKARQKEVTQKRHVLFPLTLVPFEDVRRWEQFNADLGEDTAKEIREFFVPDFSGWKTHHAYQPAFERLLKALKNLE
jgi:uncharacterized protein YjbI with pentapeptide repeats